jgi:hypothetical protein
MGHQKLGRLPRSKIWQGVVALLNAGAPMPEVAAATARAAERSMIDAASDPATKHAFWLLTQVPLAARGKNPFAALKRLGIAVSNDPSLADVAASLMAAVDRELIASGGGSDYGEIAELSAVESLYALASREPDLLGEGREVVAGALGRLAEPNTFAVLAREFFSRLTRRHLNYFLSRELGLHVGPAERFTSLRDHAAFEAALEQHCKEASRIIKEFATQWFAKHTREDGIDRAKAGRFVHMASKKIRDELEQRREAHA